MGHSWGIFCGDSIKDAFNQSTSTAPSSALRDQLIQIVTEGAIAALGSFVQDLATYVEDIHFSTNTSKDWRNFWTEAGTNALKAFYLSGVTMNASDDESISALWEIVIGGAGASVFDVAQRVFAPQN